MSRRKRDRRPPGNRPPEYPRHRIGEPRPPRDSGRLVPSIGPGLWPPGVIEIRPGQLVGLPPGMQVSMAAPPTEAQYLGLNDPTMLLLCLLHLPPELCSPLTDRRLEAFAAASLPWEFDPERHHTADLFVGTFGFPAGVQGHLWMRAVYGAYTSVRRAAEVAGLLRCVMGNPWRPVHVRAAPGTPLTMREDPCRLEIAGPGDPVNATALLVGAGGTMVVSPAWGSAVGVWAVPPEPPWLAWRDGTVPRLAAAIAETGDLDRLPVLGDALEEAGCTSAEVLGHCRGPGPHARGCWVIELLRGEGRNG
jgi:hypothetical protein